MSNYCIIPARGGSKRIPRKNIKIFAGRPIITYAINAAIESKIFDDVIVSTDDEEIKEIALEYGASVPFLRSVENSNDQATTFDALKEVINWLESNHKIKINSICCFYPCSPMIRSNELIKANKLFKNSMAGSLIPIINYSHPIQRALKLSERSFLSMVNKKNYLKRTQDLDETFYDAGQFYFFKRDVIKKFNGPFESTVVGYEIDPLLAQDIDNESDWRIAEIKYKILNEIS